MTVVGTTPEGIELAARVEVSWREAGAAGGFLARNLATGAQLGFGTEVPMPLASVVKVPVALVACDLIERGDLDPAREVRSEPDRATPGPTGLSVFGHPATVAVGDLLGLMLSISDNAASDAVLDLVGLDTVRRRLRDWGCHDVLVRHRISALYDALDRLAGDDLAVALELAIRASRADGDHPLPLLDVTEANTGTAEALVTLLERIWTDRISTPAATARLRGLMSRQVARHRLPAELGVDGIRVSSKTGTLLNLRHEIGVVETSTGDVIAIAALTASQVPGILQPEIDYAIGSAARDAVDLLRE